MKRSSAKNRKRIQEERLRDEMQGLSTVYYLEQIEEISLDIKKILLTEGYYPVPYKDANELFEQSLEQIPAIFFISISHEDGLGLIKRIKAEEKLREIFVIASGVKKSGEKAAMEAGADVYLPKPYIWRILPYTIQSLIFIDNLQAIAQTKDADIKLMFTPGKETIAEIHF
jgi:DNA-binding response OmpR family regulator